MACFDFSKSSMETITYALHLSRDKEIEVLIINVINIKDVEAVKMASRFYPDTVDAERFVEEALADRHKRVNEMLSEQFPADAAGIKVLVQVGTPFEEILNAIETEKVDLVIMGNKGRTNLSRTLFGSHAEKVFRHSPVPVLSIRDRNEFGRNE